MRALAMSSFATLVFASWVSGATSVQNPNDQLRHWAEFGQTDAVRKLLAGSEEVDVNSRDENGWTALMYAIKAGHDTIVRLLLDAGGNSGLENEGKETALHIAAKHGRIEAVRLLLEAGADFEVRDVAGRTPLYRAIEHKEAEIIEIIQSAALERSEREGSLLDRTPRQETTPPKIVESSIPAYTKSALKKGIEGTVVLMVLIRRDGSVGAVSVSKSLEESLDQSAMQAVRNWTFEPATRGGLQVDVVMEIKVDFTLPQER